MQSCNCLWLLQDCIEAEGMLGVEACLGQRNLREIRADQSGLAGFQEETDLENLRVLERPGNTASSQGKLTTATTSSS